MSRSKKGTIVFARLCTVCCVVDGMRLTLGVELVTRQNYTAELVHRLVKQCLRHNIRISILTLDRGFYSTEVISTIKSMGIRFVMPAIKHKMVKAAIDEYIAGKRKAISDFIVSNEWDSVKVKLVIIHRDKVDKLVGEAAALFKLYEKQVKLYDNYYVFVTNAAELYENGSPRDIAERYRKRWGIENSYKSYEQLRPRTNSTMRILYLFLPFVSWIIARFLAVKRGFATHDRPLCTLMIFVELLLDPLNVAARKGLCWWPPD